MGRLDKFWSLLGKFANLRFDFTFGVGDVPLLQKRSCFAFFDYITICNMESNSLKDLP